MKYMDSMYYEDLIITEDNGLFKLARYKEIFGPEKEMYNSYYLITSSQLGAANDLIFRISKDKYEQVMDSNFDEELVSDIMNRQIVLQRVIHKPGVELEEMLNDNNQNEEEQNYTK